MMRAITQFFPPLPKYSKISRMSVTRSKYVKISVSVAAWMVVAVAVAMETGDGRRAMGDGRPARL